MCDTWSPGDFQELMAAAERRRPVSRTWRYPRAGPPAVFCRDHRGSSHAEPVWSHDGTAVCVVRHAHELHDQHYLQAECDWPMLYQRQEDDGTITCVLNYVDGASILNGRLAHVSCSRMSCRHDSRSPPTCLCRGASALRLPEPGTVSSQVRSGQVYYSAEV
jgi:hypothetical protein